MNFKIHQDLKPTFFFFSVPNFIAGIMFIAGFFFMFDVQIIGMENPFTPKSIFGLLITYIGVQKLITCLKIEIECYKSTKINYLNYLNAIKTKRNDTD